MTTTETTRTHTIDAAGKRLGTVATEATKVLLGKDSASFTKNSVAPVTVTIVNVRKLDITEKRGEMIYQTYSGYPGGRRTETLHHLGHRLGYGEAVRRTVAGMLPNNKLKKLRLKNLIITE